MFDCVLLLDSARRCLAAFGKLRQFERLICRPLNTSDLASVVGRIVDLEIGSGDTLSNEQTAVAIRRVVHLELEACATAINRSDKKAALDQLSEATAKLKRLAAGLIQRFT